MIGLAYALKGEIRSILKTMNPKLLETVSGVAEKTWAGAHTEGHDYFPGSYGGCLLP